MSTAPALDMDRIIDDRRTRIIVCCGSGGVGKTTAAAAIGLRAAERGRQACVLTVDPARRLAQSMGLTSLDNTPREVDGVDTGALAAALAAAGLHGGDTLAKALAEELTEHRRQVETQDRERGELESVGQPCYEMPMITDGIDLAGLYRLATALRDQGAA